MYKVGVDGVSLGPGWMRKTKWFDMRKSGGHGERDGSSEGTFSRKSVLDTTVGKVRSEGTVSVIDGCVRVRVWTLSSGMRHEGIVGGS